MYLCPECFLQGYCRRLRARLVTDEELASPAFLAEVRAHAHMLGIGRDRWKAFLIDAYRDYPGQIIDAEGNEVELDTGVFDKPRIRYWFRDICKPVPAGTTPRLRREGKERFRTLATILRAIDPAATVLWGVRAANDDLPSMPIVTPKDVAGCPYFPSYRHGPLIRFDAGRTAK